MLVFLESNLTGFQMDWTLLSFLNEVFVLVSMSYFENAVCMCVAQKICNAKQKLAGQNAMQKMMFLLLSKWHGMLFSKTDQTSMFFYLKNSILKNMLSFRKRNLKNVVFKISTVLSK